MNSLLIITFVELLQKINKGSQTGVSLQDFVQVTLDIPKGIQEGLLNGQLERVGSIIRDAKTKQIVMWLREVGDVSIKTGTIPNIFGTVGVALNAATLATNVLSLGMSTITLAVVLQRTAMLENRLKEVQDVLNKIGFNVDILVYAKIKTAFDQANDALQMNDQNLRRTAAMNAINQLFQAWNLCNQLVDEHLNKITPVADEYLLTLFVIALAQARCYLELGEYQLSRQRIEESLLILRPKVKQYVENLLTDNPIIYLQSALTGQTSLKRLTRIYQWLDNDRTLDESALFDRFRKLLFTQKLSDKKWIGKLPTAIYHPNVDLPPRTDIFANLNVLGISIGNAKDTESLVYARLAQTMVEMEIMIESYERFESYVAEIQFLQEANMSLEEWNQLKPEQALPENTEVVFITPNSEKFVDQERTELLSQLLHKE